MTFDSNAPDHATNISQIFLGTRIECAKCHNHPWEKWTQDDFYGFAAFFARVAIKEIHDDDENEHYYAEEGKVIHPKTKQVVTPKYLDGGYEKDEPEKDIRVPLAAWMTSPKNPFFARAMVNRMWKHYLGRGLVEEVDDFRVTNPPSNPALLDALAADFSGHGYDLRHIIRTILNSRDLSAQRRAHRIGPQRHAELFALLHAAADGRGDARHDQPGDWRSREIPRLSSRNSSHASLRGAARRQLHAGGLRPAQSRDHLRARFDAGYRADPAPDQRRHHQQEARGMEARSGVGRSAAIEPDRAQRPLAVSHRCRSGAESRRN